jgi:hypothetical protein
MDLSEQAGHHDTNSIPNCPTVPPPGIGTVGQSVSGTDKGGTRAGTATVPARMKALKKLAFLRDRQRDKRWDNGDERPVPTVPPTSPERDRGGTVNVGAGRARSWGAANPFRPRLSRRRRLCLARPNSNAKGAMQVKPLFLSAALRLAAIAPAVLVAVAPHWSACGGPNPGRSRGSAI